MLFPVITYYAFYLFFPVNILEYTLMMLLFSYIVYSWKFWLRWILIYQNIHEKQHMNHINYKQRLMLFHLFGSMFRLQISIKFSFLQAMCYTLSPENWGWVFRNQLILLSLPFLESTLTFLHVRHAKPNSVHTLHKIKTKKRDETRIGCRGTYERDASSGRFRL